MTGYLLACDNDPEVTAIAARYWERAGLHDRIDLRLAPALETLQSQLDEGQGESFDMAFIDADKTSYQQYYEKCLALLRQGGIILVDNVFWNGRVVDKDDESEDTRAIRAFNDFVCRDKRIQLSMLPLADGLTIARKL